MRIRQLDCVPARHLVQVRPAPVLQKPGGLLNYYAVYRFTVSAEAGVHHLYWFISKHLIMCERPRRTGFIVPPLLKFLNLTGHSLFTLFVLSVAVLTVSVFLRWE